MFPPSKPIFGLCIGVIVVSLAILIYSTLLLVQTGVLGKQSSNLFFSKCKNAAAFCSQKLALGGERECGFCDADCVDSNGKDIMESWNGSAILCCKRGNVEAIYEGSNKRCE
ncbi:MAG: hypothetical protein QW735_02155 [archaeon]